MKIFGFLTNEDKFVHIVCNVILSFVLIVIFALSIFLPIDSSVYTSSKVKAYYRGNENERKVSLMINVYWGEEYLDKMLKALADNDVKATFFVGGCWVAKNNENLQKIFEAGHEIGNHGYYHKDHTKLTATQNRDEIHLTAQLVESLTGSLTTLFAPPSGSFNSAVLTVADSMGYKVIMWSKDTIDWRDKDENLIYSRATKNIENGDLILMHPTKATANMLDKIIRKIKSENFEIVKVSENIKDG